MARIEMEMIFTGLENYLQSLKDYVEQILEEKCCHDVQYFGTIVARYREIGWELCNFWDANYPQFQTEDAQYLRHTIHIMSAIVALLDRLYESFL